MICVNAVMCAAVETAVALSFHDGHMTSGCVCNSTNPEDLLIMSRLFFRMEIFKDNKSIGENQINYE